MSPVAKPKNAFELGNPKDESMRQHKRWPWSVQLETWSNVESKFEIEPIASHHA
jgi:hypothetical protein